MAILRKQRFITHTKYSHLLFLKRTQPTDSALKFCSFPDKRTINRIQTFTAHP